jgi:hypothetical protein
MNSTDIPDNSTPTQSSSDTHRRSQYQTSDQVVSTDDFVPTQPSSRPDGRRFPLFNGTGTQSLSLAKSHQNNSDNNKSSDHASGQNGTGKKIFFDVHYLIILVLQFMA